MSDGNGKLPVGWEVASIEDIARTATGGTPSRKRDEYYGGDISWVKSGDLNDGIVTKANESITQLGLDKSNAKIFPKGAVCIALYGATVGKLGILSIDATTNQAVCGIFPEEGVVPKYVFYALRNERANLIAQAQGGAQPNISNGIVKRTRLQIAPEAEQRRIVSKIESLQERSSRARDALSEVGPLLDQFRQSVLRAAFSGRLTADWRAAHPDVEPASELLTRIRTQRRHRWEQSEHAKYQAKNKQPSKDWQDKYREPESVDESELEELPDGWCWAKWSQIGECQNGRAFPSKHYADSGVKLLRPGNLYATGEVGWTEKNTRCMPIEWEEKQPTYVVGPDELVMNLTAQSLKDEFLGRVCRTGDDEHCLLNQRIARLTPSAPISAEFCLLLLKSPQFRGYVDTLNSGSLIQHMFTTQLNDFVFALPPLSEHAAIVGIAKEGLRVEATVLATLASSAAELTQLDQSILAKAFRGELVPQDPRDEPASELLARIRATRKQAEHHQATQKNTQPPRKKKAKAKP